MKKITFILCTLAFILSSCVKPESEETANIIADAKSYIEGNGLSYNLPIYAKVATKTAGFSNTVTLDWEKAIVNELSEKTVVEVPFSGPYRLKAAYMTSRNGKKQYRRATTTTYMVLEKYKDGRTDAYVETFIQRGKKCDVTKFKGSNGIAFIIISDLDGNVTKQEIAVSGKNYEMPEKSSNEQAESAIGFRLALVKVMATKSCPQYQTLICPVCGTEFEGNITDFNLNCPRCHSMYYSWDITECPSCGKPWTHCTCQNAGQSCASCGRNPENWPCSPDCVPGKNCTCGQ